MAGMDGGAAPRGHDKKKKKHKKMRRLGVRIDMTPMVDVAFLLLTFFMLTTSMKRPQTMEINLPPDSKAKVEVAQSNLMTLMIAEDGQMYWQVGVDPLQKTDMKSLRALITGKLQQNPKLITLIKIDRKGKYHYMVDVMDELNLANMQRFSLAPMADADRLAMQKIAS
jgi:biopolymer transport protein ExbD